MDAYAGLGGFESLPALGVAIAVFVAVCVLVEHLLGSFVGAVDSFRGRDHCHFCGAPLPSRDGLGYEARCRACERGQPWS
ncbi:MAG: hypothetical protein ABR529_08985 [Actinomycetota bacterium]